MRKIIGNRHWSSDFLLLFSESKILKNHPLLQVEIEVPQTCSFIVRTSGCSLSEVVDMDPEGNPVFHPGPSSGAFAAEMERYVTQ